MAIYSVYLIERMSGLCAYRNIFGAPNTGVHSIRFAGLAIVDVVLTLVVAGGISYGWSIAFWKTAGVLFLLGIVLHHMFCVRTTVDRLLFA